MLLYPKYFFTYRLRSTSKLNYLECPSLSFSLPNALYDDEILSLVYKSLVSVSFVTLSFPS